MRGRHQLIVAVVLILVCAPATALAGPPYTTDDPEPVDYRHWELYLASAVGHDKNGWTGIGPHFEAHYGALRNAHLHLIAVLCSYSQPTIRELAECGTPSPPPS
jgi:hypothetical protein